jgi:FO synthase
VNDLAERGDLPGMMLAAEELAVTGFGHRITYSRKVFIPLTHLCRHVCPPASQR